MSGLYEEGPAGRPATKADEEDGRSFYARLPGVMAYPLKGQGAFVIVGGTIFLLALRGLQALATGLFGRLLGLWLLAQFASLILTFYIAGLLGGYMITLVSSAASGEPDPPNWPVLRSLWADVFRPILLIVSACLISFYGMILCRAFGAHFGKDTEVWYWVLGAGGALYLPMALIGVSLFDSLDGVNPLVVIPAAFRVGPAYLIASVALAAVVGIHLTIRNLIGGVPIIRWLLADAVTIYFLMVEMRICGLIYYCYRERLGWFE